MNRQFIVWDDIRQHESPANKELGIQVGVLPVRGAKQMKKTLGPMGFSADWKKNTSTCYSTSID